MRWRAPAAVLMAVLLVVAGCAGGSGATSSASTSAGATSPGATLPGATPPSTAPASPAIPSSPVTGIVTRVDSTGLDQVHGFSLRDNTGRQIEFTIGQLENGAAFPPGHLAEHLATAEPVRVWFREVDGRLVVYRLDDGASIAGPTSAGSPEASTGSPPASTGTPPASAGAS